MGKMIVINGIIVVYVFLEGFDFRKKSNLLIFFAVLIGWAVCCMNELIGLFSVIIYWYLGMIGDDDISYLEDYLDVDFIIVDEFFMVDIWLVN